MPRQEPARQKGGHGEAEATGANPTDRAKCGGKRHLLTEGRGIPIATILSGANRTDMKKLADLLDAKLVDDPLPGAEAEALVMRHLCLDRGYDYDACRQAASARGYTPHIPPKRSAAHPLPPPGHPDRHPPRRWVVEVAHNWFNRFRRLLARWDKQAAHYLGFGQLAACPIIYRKVRHARSLPGLTVSAPLPATLETSRQSACNHRIDNIVHPALSCGLRGYESRARAHRPWIVAACRFMFDV